jgi:hypothetical protein
MPSALLTADSAKLSIEAVKPGGKLRVGYQGWDDARVVWPGQRLSSCV